MPNWCNNTIHIYGKQEEIAAFLSKFTNKECLSFNDFVPIPKEEKENWYDWNCENWGTKWDLHKEMTTLTILDTEIQVEAPTAWAPPLKFFETLAKDYPTMTFTVSYHEEGMMFCGFAEWSEGKEKTNVALTYTSSKHLKELFEKYDAEYTKAWLLPSESELEEEEEEDDDEEVKAAESRSQVG